KHQRHLQTTSCAQAPGRKRAARLLKVEKVFFPHGPQFDGGSTLHGIHSHQSPATAGPDGIFESRIQYAAATRAILRTPILLPHGACKYAASLPRQENGKNAFARD